MCLQRTGSISIYHMEGIQQMYFNISLMTNVPQQVIDEMLLMIETKYPTLNLFNPMTAPPMTMEEVRLHEEVLFPQARSPPSQSESDSE